MKKLFTQENIIEIISLPKEESIEIIKNELIKISQEQLTILDPIETIPFVKDWNDFVNKGEISELLLCTYYEVIKTKNKLIELNKELLFNLSSLYLENINFQCSHSGWGYLIKNDSNFLPQKIERIRINATKDNTDKYEILKLYSIKNIGEISELFDDKSVDYSVISNKAIKMLLELDKSKLSFIDEKGHDVPFFKAWNLYVKGEYSTLGKENLWWHLGDNFSHSLFMSKINIKNNITAISSNFNKLTNIECRKSGKKFTLMFDEKMEWAVYQWNPKKVIVNGEIHHTGSFEPMEPIAFKSKIYKQKIVFKTGNLIINDWFRDPKNIFSELVKAEKSISINYEEGIVNQISHYAKNFNFVSVNVGNTCPSVFQLKNKILVGEGTVKSVGSVCTDLWNATIIEEEHLIELYIKGGLTKEDAQSFLDINKKIWTTISIKVEPGTYELSFTGNYEDFNKKYKKNEKGIVPYFSLEKI